MRRAALVLIVIAASVVPVYAQDPPVSLPRVRRGLATAGPLRTTTAARDSRGRPVFRTRIDEVRQREERLRWDPAMNVEVSPYVRPRYPGPHYEFLQLVTPEAFRASTVPAGVDLLGPARSLVGSIRAARRKRAEDAIRRRIKEELAALQER